LPTAREIGAGLSPRGVFLEPLYKLAEDAVPVALASSFAAELAVENRL
jgi:hypothetical protein